MGPWEPPLLLRVCCGFPGFDQPPIPEDRGSAGIGMELATCAEDMGDLDAGCRTIVMAPSAAYYLKYKQKIGGRGKMH